MKPIRIGVISDTHGLLRPEAFTALKGSARIIHAGDIGATTVIETLATIAPVTAVRGNCDREVWADSLPQTQVVTVENSSFYILHDLNQLDLNPEAAGFQIVISGHSHQPKISQAGGVLYLNPGSAGPRRFQLPVTLAWIDLNGDQIEAQIVRL